MRCQKNKVLFMDQITLIIIGDGMVVVKRIETHWVANGRTTTLRDLPCNFGDSPQSD